MLTVFAALAELERESLLECQAESIAKANEDGKMVFLPSQLLLP